MKKEEELILRNIIEKKIAESNSKKVIKLIKENKELKDFRKCYELIIEILNGITNHIISKIKGYNPKYEGELSEKDIYELLLKAIERDVLDANRRLKEIYKIDRRIEIKY